MEEPLINKVAEVLVGPTIPTTKITPPQEGRQRATFNLGNIGKVAKTADEVPVNTTERVPDKPINEERLREAWDELIVLRKDRMAEISLLKRYYTLKGTVATIALASPLEEQLFNTTKAALITFIRDRIGNSSFMIVGEVQAIAIPMIPLNNKEKFEHLAEKNPVLKEMKERFGLDPDL